MQKHVRKTYTLSPKALEALDKLADYHDMKKSAVINWLLIHTQVHAPITSPILTKKEMLKKEAK